MRALYISTRLAGTDGVSLETAKMVTVLERLGFETAYCAGEMDEAGPVGILIPEMHFADPVALELGRRAFSSKEPDSALMGAIQERAAFLKEQLEDALGATRPDLLVMQNVWAIPMQLPLALALADLAQETGLPCLSHEHDYHWERERFQNNLVPDFLETYFPFHSEKVRHLCINSLAQRDLMERRGIESVVVPNVFDFDTPAPGIDDYNLDFKEAIGLESDQRLFLQPTRVVPRKGIALAIDLLAELDDPHNVLVITHQAGDEGLDYLKELERYASARAVDLRYVADLVDDRRREQDGRKIYTLWDTYPHADFVTYPSLYEGFGNALIETVYFRKPALVNQYSVYQADIAPRGFAFVEIDTKVTQQAVAEVSRLLDNPGAARRITELNFNIGAKHFSYQSLQDILVPQLRSLGFDGPG